MSLLCCCGSWACKACYPDAPGILSPESAEKIKAAVAKDTNPKDGVGATKAPLSMIPGVALLYTALVHLAGSLKYGKWNWRKAGVRASIYLDAAQRHLLQINEGEWIDPEDGLPHAAHVNACMNILMDSYYAGNLQDDRPPSSAVKMSDYSAHVMRLRDLYKEYNPTHHTIGDAK